MAYMSWRPLTLEERNFYEFDDPQAAFRQYIGDKFGYRTNPMQSYASNLYNQRRAEYFRVSGADPSGTTMWVDALNDDWQNEIRQAFSNETATVRGEQLWYAPQGRVTGNH